jgi:anti-anti-sigma regulatory factor
MIARSATPSSSRFPVRWFGRFAVVELPAGRNFLTAPALAGELCAALDAGHATGLIVDLSSSGVCDATRLEALMRAARRAQGAGSWLRLVIPDAGARKMVRLVALDEVMPVHTSVPDAVAVASWEDTVIRPGLDPGGRDQADPAPDWRREKAMAWIC